MPRLPDYTDLGPRPIPQSRRELARNPHAGAVGEALQGFGEAVGDVALRWPVKPDRAALAAARARLLAADVTLRQSLVHEVEHEAWAPRYAEAMQAARAEAMARIASPADRALFAQQADLDQARGAAEIGRAARKARLEDDLATLHTAAQAAPDEATRVAVFDTVHDHIAAAQDHGDLDPDKAGELRREWVRSHAAQRLDRLLEADDLDQAERFLTAHRDKLDPEANGQFEAQLGERKQMREHLTLAEQARQADSTDGAPDLAARLAHVDAQALPPEQSAAVKRLVIADAQREAADLAAREAEADQAAGEIVTKLGDQFTDILMLPAPLRRAMSPEALEWRLAEAAWKKASAVGSVARNATEVATEVPFQTLGGGAITAELGPETTIDGRHGTQQEEAVGIENSPLEEWLTNPLSGHARVSRMDSNEIDESGLGGRDSMDLEAADAGASNPLPTPPAGAGVVDQSRAIATGWDGSDDVSLMTTYDTKSMQDAAWRIDLPGVLTVYSHGGPQVYQRTGPGRNAFAPLSSEDAAKLIARAGGDEPILLLGCSVAERPARAGVPSGKDYIYQISDRLGRRPIMAANENVWTSRQGADGWIEVLVWKGKPERQANGKTEIVRDFDHPGRFKTHNGHMADFGISLKPDQFVHGFRFNATTRQAEVMIAYWSNGELKHEKVPWRAPR